jgi:hypothetical protein
MPFRKKKSDFLAERILSRIALPFCDLRAPAGTFSLATIFARAKLRSRKMPGMAASCLIESA